MSTCYCVFLLVVGFFLSYRPLLSRPIEKQKPEGESSIFEERLGIATGIVSFLGPSIGANLGTSFHLYYDRYFLHVLRSHWIPFLRVQIYYDLAVPLTDEGSLGTVDHIDISGGPYWLFHLTQDKTHNILIGVGIGLGLTNHVTLQGGRDVSLDLCYTLGYEFHYKWLTVPLNVRLIQSPTLGRRDILSLGIFTGLSFLF